MTNGDEEPVVTIRIFSDYKENLMTNFGAYKNLLRRTIITAEDDNEMLKAFWRIADQHKGLEAYCYCAKALYSVPSSSAYTERDYFPASLEHLTHSRAEFWMTTWRRL